MQRSHWIATALVTLWLVPALAQAQDDAPDLPGGASVLQVEDAPDQIIEVNTRIRHTTVIQLPAHENILDFIVGDSEYWHLTGAANLAFLKPIGEASTPTSRSSARAGGSIRSSSPNETTRRT